MRSGKKKDISGGNRKDIRRRAAHNADERRADDLPARDPKEAPLPGRPPRWNGGRTK